MKMRVGLRLKSQVSAVEIIVVRATSEDVDLRCGGVVMVEDSDGTPTSDVDPELAEPTLLGKRYVDEDATVEVLCTKGGTGQLAIGSEPLTIKEAKPLPSSD